MKKFATLAIAAVLLLSPLAEVQAAVNRAYIQVGPTGQLDGTLTVYADFFDGSTYVSSWGDAFQIATTTNYTELQANARARTVEYATTQGWTLSQGLIMPYPMQSDLESAISTAFATSTYQADWNQASSTLPGFIKNKPTILPLSYYHNGSVQSGAKLVTFSGTTTSGTATFHLTTNGTSGGTAICSAAPQHVNVIANDPNNTFGLGWALSNSNKTLTVTANVRSFTNTTILGITVLGSSSVSAAPNGTPINVSVVCN